EAGCQVIVLCLLVVVWNLNVVLVPGFRVAHTNRPISALIGVNVFPIRDVVHRIRGVNTSWHVRGVVVSLRRVVKGGGRSKGGVVQGTARIGVFPLVTVLVADL